MALGTGLAQQAPGVKKAPIDAPAGGETAVDRQTEAENEKKPIRLPFRGNITKVDLKTKQIILKGKTTTRIFRIQKTTKITRHDKPVKLESAKAGEPVRGYAQKTDKSHVYDLITLKLGPKATAKKPDPSKPDESDGTGDPRSDAESGQNDAVPRPESPASDAEEGGEEPQ